MTSPPPSKTRGQPKARRVPLAANSRMMAAYTVLSNAPEWVLIAESARVVRSDDTPSGRSWQSAVSIWAYRQGFEVVRRNEPDAFRVYARYPHPVPEFEVIVE